jgi:hypothetical protein
MWFPELARDWCILGAVYCVFTFGFTLLTLPSPLSATRSSSPLISSPFVSSVAFWISELLFLAGCVYYAQYKSEWPITQRAAWLLESVVLLMKMHSYVTVNRQLKMEVRTLLAYTWIGIWKHAFPYVCAQVDAGGPGTGAIIFHLQHADFIQFKGKTKEAATAHADKEHVPAEKPANGNAKASPRAAAGPRLRGARKRSTSRAAQAPAQPQTEKPVVAPAADGNSQAITSPSGPTGWSLWSSLLRGLRKDFGTQELDSAAESGQNSAAVYPISKYFTFLGMDSQPTPGSAGNGSKGPVWASRTFWAHRAEAARNLIGKVVYGVNYEGQMTTTGIVAFPNNVNLKDFILFSFAPVLCYEPNYPRTQSVRLWYLAEKLFLSAGLVVAGVYMHSHYVLPVIAKIHEMDEITAAVQLLGPLTALMLVSFFVIFECILNAFAEFTRFGDRAFYEDWWNATTFLEWNRYNTHDCMHVLCDVCSSISVVCRKWNRPVHTFLLRHIYLDVMRQYGASASTALYATFLVSIVLHEVVVWGITGRSMPWLGLFSLLQFPLGSIQRIRWIKGKRLGNMILWIGLTVGITLITVLYSKNYCQRNPGSCK